MTKGHSSVMSHVQYHVGVGMGRSKPRCARERKLGLCTYCTSSSELSNSDPECEEPDSDSEVGTLTCCDYWVRTDMHI